jgi:hypothetical protein
LSPGSHHSFSFYTDKEARIDRPSDPIYRQFVEEFGELAGEISYRLNILLTLRDNKTHYVLWQYKYKCIYIFIDLFI